MMQLLIFILIALMASISAFTNSRISRSSLILRNAAANPRNTLLTMTASTPSSTRDGAASNLSKWFKVGKNTLVASSVLISTQRASAASITASTLSESKKAAQGIQECLTKISSMEALANAKEWTKIGKILGEKCFTGFSDTAYILTKSEVVTAEDKVALGTIKRYGTVADAIIMMGGLAEALRAGGIEVAGGGSGYSDQAPIIDEEEMNDDDEAKVVDPKEVMKYIKLSKGSLEDINRISAPILKM